jgi:hypothetical protein
MDLTVGQPFKDDALVIDASYTPITGVTWTDVVNQDPDGDPIAYTVTDLLNGAYVIEFVPLKVGSYNLIIVSDTSPPQYWEFHADVGAAVTAGGFTGVGATVGTTLQSLIEQVADNLSDLLQIVATQDGADDGRTWIDDLNLSAISMKSLKGADLYVTLAAGSNLGRNVRVLDSTSDPPATLTLTPALPEMVATGDQADLVNLESRGVRWQTYARVINQAIGLTFPNYLEPMTYAVPTLFDRTAPTVAVPNLTHIARVDWLDTDGTWQEIPAAVYGNVGWNGWAWDDFYQVLVIGGEQGLWADGKTVRVVGYGRPQPLGAPTDVTGVDPEWLVATVTATLERRKGDPRLLAVASMDQNIADTMRTKMGVQLPADTVRIR